MGRLKQTKKIISIYSNVSGYSCAEYAINLASGLAKISGTKVLLIEFMGSCGGVANMLRLDERNLSDSNILNCDIGIDILVLEHIEQDRLEQLRNIYRYIIIYLPFKTGEVSYDALSYSDSIHLFAESTEENLKSGYDFLEDLLDKGLKDLHDRIKIIVSRLNIFDKLNVEEMAWLLRRDIWAMVPEPGILEAAVDSKGLPLVLNYPAAAYSKVLLYLAKHEADMLLGLALGSGAAFGLAHIGVLKVLERYQIPIDVLSGSSIGALIASMWGLGLSSDKIEQITRKLKDRLNIMRLLDFTLPISGILAGRRLKRFLKSILGEKTFEDLQIPVKIIVYDLANRQTLVMDTGLLVEAVYKSVAVPGIFEPITEKDRMIVDGGISEPVPIDILLKQGVKKIIAVNVLPGTDDVYKRSMFLKKKRKEEWRMSELAPFYIKLSLALKNFFIGIFTPNIFDVIVTSMQSMEYVLAENSCRKADVVLHPVLSSATSIDFHLAKDFIKIGEQEASFHIEEIKGLVAG